MKMKKITGLVLVAYLLVLGNLFAQPLTIQGNWKIKFEDKTEFSKADYNDAEWENLPALKWSDDHKTTANRTLWVRKKVIIPSSLQSEFAKTGLLCLAMGKIQQSDDTYLNGKLVGSTGSGDSYRNYLITKEDILWDKENTIAIRVSHWGTFSISKTPKFSAATPSVFFGFTATIKNGNSKEPVHGKQLDYQLSIANKAPMSLAGMVKADFYNFQGDKVNTAQKEVNLSMGNNSLVFPYKSLTPFIKVVYTLSIPAYQYNTEWNAEFGYENLVYKSVTPVVAYKAPQHFFPAELDKIHIDGWLGERLKANTQQRLEKVDEDAILAGFVNRPGNHSWIGEHIGKFLDAACNAYANNADPALKIQIDRSAQQLIAAQLPDGYLGTYDMDSHWTSWDVWSHRYDLMGLLRYYQLSGFKPALRACEKIGDLVIQTFGDENGKKDIIKSGPHVGMAATRILESMTELYRFTGNKKYLDYCYYLVKTYDHKGGPRIITTLDSIGRVDKVANAKAYEMMSNFLGIIKLYRLTNDEAFLKPLETAWKDIVATRLYITGTASSFEHFQDDAILPATDKDNMGEGCVTTTWIQFNYQLFCITGQMKYLDQLERAVYNHLTGAENPQTGGVSYYTPLMGKKPYRTVITCCMSSVPRGIAMIPLFANGKINSNPAFLFYQPGIYTTSVDKKPLSFTTSGDFLSGQDVTITVNDNCPAATAITFRKPYWATDFSLLVNGQKQTITNTETIDLKRLWKKGDVITVSFKLLPIVLDGGKSYPNQIALQRGPQVLAFDQSINGVEASGVKIDAKNIQLLTPNSPLPSQWIGGKAFQLKAANNNTDTNIILVPYADASQTGGVISTWINKQ